MNVIQALKTIPDPRSRRGRQYPLFGLLAIVLLAAMHGERSLRGMWLWARARQDDLLTHPALGLRAVRRIPSLATFWYAVRTTPAGELERTPVLVVCAGAKAILDLPATLEYLETGGVPVLGWRTAEFPAFYSVSSGLPVAYAQDASFVARAWKAHRALGGAGMVLAVPPPVEDAIDRAVVEAAIERALNRAVKEGVHGPAVTPFLLAALARETEGESVRVNVALLRQNARIAAQVATAIAGI